jgi:hypothetical protein
MKGDERRRREDALAFLISRQRRRRFDGIASSRCSRHDGADAAGNAANHRRNIERALVAPNEIVVRAPAS